MEKPEANMRKLHTAALLLLIVSAISLFVWAVPEDSVKVYAKKITFDQTTRTVNVVDVDLIESISSEPMMPNT